VIFTFACVAAGDATGDGAGLAFVTGAAEFLVFGPVTHALPIASATARKLKSKRRDSLVINSPLLFVQERVGVDICAFPVTVWIGDDGD